MERDQFTFYKSFYMAMRRITDKVVRADIYDCLCMYALFQQVPELDDMAPEATLMYEMAKPVLDAAREKSKNGSIGKNKTESNENQTKIKPKSKQNQNRIKKEEEIEKEIEIENETEHECEAAFDRFWDAYPRKVKKQDAREAFERVSVSLDVLLQALKRQKLTSQWQEDGGRFVPYPAAWLSGCRWEDEVTCLGTLAPRTPEEVPRGCGPMQAVELGDIAKQMGGE